MVTIISEKDVLLLLAKRVKELRLSAGYSRESLAKKSGVNYATLRVFESTGKVSLGHLLLLASALGRLDEFTALFLPAAARTILELTAKPRKRGRK